MSLPPNVLTIELPIEGLPALTDPTDKFADEARFLLALKLFEQGRISSGKAGTLCGLIGWDSWSPPVALVFPWSI